MFLLFFERLNGNIFSAGVTSEDWRLSLRGVLLKFTVDAGLADIIGGLLTFCMSTLKMPFSNEAFLEALTDYEIASFRLGSSREPNLKLSLLLTIFVRFGFALLIG